MWKELNSISLAREYSPSSVVSNFWDVIREYEERSRKAIAFQQPSVLSYGSRQDERYIYFEAKSSVAPALLVFIHGGYWQELSADVSCFPAEECVRRGVSYAAVDYTLAPEASVATIVEQCARAVAEIAAHFRHRFPGARVVISGSSAGAHLAAMLMAIDWKAMGCDTTPFQGAVLMSGVYDLQPIVPTYINEKPGLDPAEALRLSPQFLPTDAAVPAIVCCGANETSEFKRQSRDYAGRLDQAGQLLAAYEVEDRHHFDVVFDLCDASTRLGGDTFQLLRTTP